MSRVPLRSTAVAFAAAAVTAALAQAGLSALGADDSVPQPRISSAPFARTISSRATIAFDGRPGLAYACSVDDQPAVICTSPFTFRDLEPGAHRVVVRAARSAEALSSAATHRWTIVRPRPRGLYSSSRARTVDGVPVRPVLATAPIRPWLSRSATFAWVTKRGLKTECRLDLGLWRACVDLATYRRLPPGPHRFAVRGVSSDGRTSTPNRFAWTITGDAPPAGAPGAPVLIGAQEGSTTSSTAAVAFGPADGETLPAGAGYACRLDGSAWSACTSPIALVGLAPGRHTLCVRVEQIARSGPAACATWTVVATAPAAGTSAPSTPAVPTAPGGFTISGSLTTPLAPGVAAPLPLTLTNPNAVDVRITGLTVSVDDLTSAAGCSGTANFAVTQSSLSSSPTGIVVPAGSAVALPIAGPEAPVVAMRQLPTDQDACKGATVTLLYTAIGSEP